MKDWVSMVDEYGRRFLWNRRHQTSHWDMPPGTLPWWVRPIWETFLEVESQVEVESLLEIDGRWRPCDHPTSCGAVHYGGLRP